MAQLESLTLEARGLYTFSNTYSEETAPSGSLAIAKNIVIDKDGIISPRRGQEKLFTESVGSKLSTMTVYGNKLFVHDLGQNSIKMFDGVITDVSVALLKTLTNVSKPADAVSVKFAESSKSLFLTTAQGVQKIDSTDVGVMDIVDAGVAPAVGLETRLVAGSGTAIRGCETQDYDKLVDSATGVNIATEEFTSTAHGFINGDIVRVSTAGTLPTPLVVATDYYIVNSAANTFKISATNGGSAIDITSTGSGIQRFTRKDPTESRVAVNYVAVWGRKDRNGVLLEGAPSSKQILVNTTTTPKDAEIKVYIPKRITTTDYFCRLYRTLNVGTPMALTTNIDPGDEFKLVIEVVLDNTMLTNGYVDFTDAKDITPDTLMQGAALYTNSTQEGIAAAAYQPPQCIDLAFYQNHMFFGNTKQPYNYTFTLISVDPTSGLQSGDKIVVQFGANTVTYEADSALGSRFNVGTRKFKLEQGINPFVDIENTAKNFVDLVNNDRTGAANSYYAIYDVGPLDPPGRVKLVETDFGAATDFTVKIQYLSGNSNNANTTFNPPLLHNTVYASSNESFTNRIYYSKFQEPEAVPLVNYFDIGSSNDVIKRVIPLKNQLVVMTDRAIWAITGTDQNSFAPTLLDNTTRLLAPDSAISLSNQVYALFDQGIGRIATKTVEIISRPIEGELLEIRGNVGDEVETRTFGVAYESDRKYLLFLKASVNGIPMANKAYVFNTATDTWTTYEISATAGYIGPNDKLITTRERDIIRERKNFNDFDVSGEDFDFVVNDTQFSPDKLSIAMGTATLSPAWPKADDILWRINGQTFYYTKVTEVSKDSNGLYVIYLRDDINFPLVPGPNTLKARAAIPVEWEYNPITAGHPAIVKQWSESTLITRKSLENFNILFASGNSLNFDAVSFSGQSSGGWGTFAWGTIPWGGETFSLRYRTYIPRNKQRDPFLSVKIKQATCLNNFEVVGLQIMYRNLSSRSVK